MATIKSYTSVEQGKKLAEFLPLESVDMTYCATTEGTREKMIIKDWELNVGLDIAIKKNLFSYKNGYMIPCWSLAALLNVIPISYKDEGRYCLALINTNPKADHFAWCACYEDDNGHMIMKSYAETPVDACVDMIIKLRKYNLL